MNLAIHPGGSLAWRELRAELRRFVAARVAPSDVDDVVQEALARIHRGVTAVRDQDRLGAWVYQVARSAIVDHHRRARPSAELDEDMLPTPVIEADDTAFEALAGCMTPFVALLPPVYRQAITLVELDGLSQVAAAERLGIAVSTMKSRVQRGRAELRRLVEDCCAIGLDARGHVLELTPRRPRCAC